MCLFFSTIADTKLDAQAIWGECICDSLGDMNIFASDGRHFYYGIKESVPYKDMVEFAKDPAVTVVLNNNSGEYELLSDGSLKLLTLYMDTVTYK